MNNEFEKIYEMACAGDGGSSSVASSAPEHTINIVNGKEEKQLKESSFDLGWDKDEGYESDRDFDEFDDSTEYFEEDPLDRMDDENYNPALWENIDKRLELRKQLNQLREAEDPDEEKIGKIRYQLQKFTNGGTPYVDENGVAQIDGEKDGPSAYEAWRAGINNKKRDARLKLEKEDRESSFASPRHTTPENPDDVLDNQTDAFLAWYLKKYGGK